MFNRIIQVYNLFFGKFTSKDEEEVMKYLDEFEYNLFKEMSLYDKRHSFFVFKEMKQIENREIMYKLALLHDIGKSGKIGFWDRVEQVITKKNQKLSNHARIGYEKMKDYNRELAELIKIHHDRNINNEMIEIFQKIDDRC